MVTKQELKAVKEQIRKEPELFKMCSWTFALEGCGTTHCIGGWLQHLNPDKYNVDSFDSFDFSEGNMPDVSDGSLDKYSNLFHVTEWNQFISEDLEGEIQSHMVCEIDDWNNDSYDGIDDAIKVELTCKVIDEYIELYNIK